MKPLEKILVNNIADISRHLKAAETHYIKEKTEILEYIERSEEYLKKDIENKEAASIEESINNVEYWNKKFKELEKEIEGIEKLQTNIIEARLKERS